MNEYIVISEKAMNYFEKKKVEKKDISGIILATVETKRFPAVVALGPDYGNPKLKKIVKVVYKEYSGTNIKIDEVDYIVIEEKDILA